MENKNINLEAEENEANVETAAKDVEEVTHEQTLKLMSPMQMVIRRFFRSKLSIVGLVMVVSLFLFCWVGPLVYNVSPTEIDKDGKIEYTEKEVTYTDENGVLHHNGFDIVLANMPYSQKTKHGSLYDLPSTNGDSICVQHCMKAINSAAENGRMALVVPEGFLFRKDLAKTREYLLDHCQLQSIISLPQGVFLPYTGVKTDIIYATHVNKKIKASEKKKNFWYFDVKSVVLLESGILF